MPCLEEQPRAEGRGCQQISREGSIQDGKLTRIRMKECICAACMYAIRTPGQVVGIRQGRCCHSPTAFVCGGVPAVARQALPSLHGSYIHGEHNTPSRPLIASLCCEFFVRLVRGAVCSAGPGSSWSIACKQRLIQ